MAGMGVKTTVKLFLRDPQDVAIEVASKMERPFTESLQDGVSVAAQLSPFLTGLNRRSIGWALKPSGSNVFSGLSTGAPVTGTEAPSVAAAMKKAIDVAGIMATSSGYGGYLAVGARDRIPEPYLIEALEVIKSNLNKRLDGIL